MSTSDMSEDGGDPLVEYRYERSPGEEPSDAVLAAVTGVAQKPIVPSGDGDRSPETDVLPPLYEAIDPDALDDLIVSGANRDNDPSVTFIYDDYEVRVGSWRVTVYGDA